MATGLNIYILGSGGVGKSALTIRFMMGRFSGNYCPTIEDTYRKKILVDNREELINVVDTAGQEEYKSLQERWVKNGNGFLIVYSITNMQSFEEIEELVDEISRIKENLEIPIIIVGNKVDLLEERQVSYQKGKSLAEKYEVPFYETSAKEEINNIEIFFQIVREIRKYNCKELRSRNSLIFKKKKKKGCIII